MKIKSVWICTSCGNRQSRWTGQCGLCQTWNTMEEEVETVVKTPRPLLPNTNPSKPVRLNEIREQKAERFTTGLQEVDRALGSGFVPGSLTLIGGDPGIGKSTLALQVAHQVSKKGQVLYICGEESLEQVALRSRRLKITSQEILFTSETEYTKIAALMDEIKPLLTIIDSIQVIYRGDIQSSPGSVTQVRECAASLMQTAKNLNIATLLVGHVTKSGEIAGPRILEHLVDTVLYFEGDRHLHLRILRVMKNRFGPTDEIAVFQMAEAGLEEVVNPSQLFLETRSIGSPGSIIIPTLEGSRPLLIEAQALVTDTFFATPSRRSTGVDQNRLALLLAVIEKRCQIRLGQCDVFASITGGLKITEPALDLGLLLAITSSFTNKPLDQKTIVVGEVGLGGEVRAVRRIEARLKEALHLGFTRAIIPKQNMATLKKNITSSIELIPIEWVDTALLEVR